MALRVEWLRQIPDWNMGRKAKGKKEANTWEECIRIGELLADEAMRIVAAAPLLVNPALYCTSRKLELPIDSEIMRYILKKSPLKYEEERELCDDPAQSFEYWARANINRSWRGFA